MSSASASRLTVIHPGLFDAALDPRERRRGHAGVERELLLRDLAILAELFEQLRQDEVRLIVHLINIAKS